MIDIDESLQALESHPSIWVKFHDPNNKEEEIGFEIKADPQRQRKLIDRSVRMSMVYGEASGQENKEQNPGTEMQITADWISLAVQLSADIINWQGFTGEFNKGKVKKWLMAFPAYAVAFAQAFKGILDEYEAAQIKRKDAALKN